MNSYWTGKKRSKETNKKISDTLKAKKIIPPSRLGATPWNKGAKMKDLRGERNPRWKGGTWHFYKREAKERDDHTCRICGLRDPEIMEVDHTKPRCDFPDLRDSLENLITICPNCHRRKTNRELRERNTGKSNNKRQRCT